MAIRSFHVLKFQRNVEINGKTLIYLKEIPFFSSIVDVYLLFISGVFHGNFHK
jgi:hypothetical protein